MKNEPRMLEESGLAQRKEGEAMLKQEWKKLIKNAARSYSSMLKRFYPSKDFNKAPAERNMTFHLAREYLKKRSHGFAFMEVPFSKKQHIDTYLFNSRAGIVVEAKQVYTQRDFHKVKIDHKKNCRFSNEELPKIHEAKGNPNKPSDLYELLLASVWVLPSKPKRKALLERWKRKGLPFLKKSNFTVGRELAFSDKESKEKCWWLYGYRVLWKGKPSRSRLTLRNS